MKAIIFPGQGSQRKGMGAKLFARHPAMLAAADDILGYSVRDLCLTDQRGELDQTRFTQPAVYVVSMLAWLERSTDAPPAFLAGHSVGEFAALTAANAFDFETGLRVVAQRAKLMSEVTGGGLAAVINQSQDAVASLIAGAGLPAIEIANVNSPVQTVVGGPKRILQQFVTFCAEHNVRAVPLRVSGPFHTSLMRPAAVAFRTYLDGVTLAMPSLPVIANVTVEPHVSATMADTLANHIASPVQWIATIERMLATGVDEFIEIGEVPVLTPMITEIRSRYANRIHLARSHIAADPIRSLPAAAMPKSNRIHDTFGTERRLIACSLGNGASGTALVRALAKSGTMAYLDTDGLDTAEVEKALIELNENPATRGRFGVALVSRPDQPETNATLVNLLVTNDVRHLELRGFDGPPPILATFRQNRKSPCSVLARVSSTRAAGNFFEAALSGFEDASHIDAICVDLINWRSAVSADAALLAHVLGRRNTAPQGRRVLVGAGGMAGNPLALASLWEMGVDFASAGCVLLTAKESAIDIQTREALREASFSQFRPVADWTNPELQSRSWSYVGCDAEAALLDELQAAYLSADLTVQTLRPILEAHRSAAHRVLPDGLIEKCEQLGTRAVRRELRTAVTGRSNSAILACDASLPQWTTWMKRRASTHSADNGAADIVALLHPCSHQPKSANRLGDLT